MVKKVYVLDTNVLIYDPNSIYNFNNAIVVIPGIVLEELDRFKAEGTDRGRSVREVTRILDRERERGSLQKGVEIKNDSVVKVVFINKKSEEPFPFLDELGDNIILRTVLQLKKDGHSVTLITKDINVRIKADALGLSAQGYMKESISTDDFYKGWRRILVPAIQLKQEIPDALIALVQNETPTLNEFIIVESQHNSYNFKIFRYVGDTTFVETHQNPLQWSLRPRNVEQMMALDLLLDDSIQLVTLFGPAGTGKTFLGLLAALHKILLEGLYEKVLISRPVVPLGKDIGYLPGDLQEKLHTWMLPIYDNMDFILHAVQAGRKLHSNEIELEDELEHYKQHHKKMRFGHKKQHKKAHKNLQQSGIMPLEQLIEQNKVSFEAIAYMRGRSLLYQFIIIDEVQNLTPHEVKTLITRVGSGSKIILVGDPYQIDSPYLNFSNNGLIVASERFKGQKMFGSVYLQTSERSELSQLAGELL